MNVFTRSTVLAGLAAAALVVAGCSTDNSMAGMSMSSSSAATTPRSTAPSAATTSLSSMSSMSGMSSGSTGQQVSPEHNAADVTFAQQMTEHHRGAIVMAQLVPDRAASQQVKDLAARIEAEQAPEIELMTGWLQAWGGAMGTTGGVDMGTTGGGTDMGSMNMSTSSSGMAGMMTDEQMAALTAASGAEFDRMFLELMVVHHQGAVEMADTELAHGSNPEALALAESIKTGQTAEIAEMQQLLQGL